MKTFITLILCCLFLLGNAQNRDEELSKHLKALTPEDEALLKSLPVKTMPADYATRSLPAVVDNSQYIYMRPAFNQEHYACGQASLIGYNFTYEMARERNVPANNTDNQYPTHFAWNFMNGGGGYYGVSYLHSAQILKNCGTPNVTTYGGMAAGGFTRWMSGYDNYLEAMENRITTISQLPVGTEEELQVLKYWLYDHLEGSEYGGLASFYAQYLTVYQTLPSGTPESGRYVITSFGGSPNHAMTIVGYNDSIRWDYNNDGQYTNDIDINGDGVVNMKDWEIGGFKMVQSYGGVPNWGDQGYAYMMYKTVADNLGQGGIWNHCVHLLDVKEEFSPELVAKVTLKHDRRLAVQVIAGFSNNISATGPDYILDIPIFNYQGGDNYMQGGTTEADKTIEFGLDLSPFLTDIDMGSSTKFFLQVSEIDPWHLGNGEIVSFTLYDYTNGVNVINSSQTNVPIIDNDTTTVYLTATINYDRVEIDTESLPYGVVGEPYSFQLTASGGATPYFWDYDKTYDETSGTAYFYEIDDTQLYPTNNSSGMVTQELAFDFPFYDSTYSSVTLHVDGYLMFDEQLYPYPYFHDDNVLFKVSRNISPFMTQYQRIYTSSGGGLWYEGDENSATFRWKTKIDGDTGTDLNYSVTLYPDGKIEYRYGILSGFGNIFWVAGISDGDNTNYTRCVRTNTRSIPENYKSELTRYSHPDEMSVTQDGLFQGTPEQQYAGELIRFKVTDNAFVSSVKELSFAAGNDDLLIFDSINSGGDNVMEYGETAFLSFRLVNDGDFDMINATLSISSNNSHITITDDTEYIGTVESGTSVWVYDGVSFDVHNDISNGQTVIIDVLVEDDYNSWETSFNYTAYAPDVEILATLVGDNGVLDPCETTDISMVFLNNGGANLPDASVQLSSQSSLITWNTNSSEMTDLTPGQTDTLVFNLTVSDEALIGQVVDFQVLLEGTNEYELTEDFSLPIGFNCEDFETGGFHLLSWGYEGNEPWQIDDLIRYEGQYGSRSGFISGDRSSSLIADIYVQAEGDLSFYKMVSSEANSDYLTFYVDGIEQDSWSDVSDWSLKTYTLEQGFHRLRWTYKKYGDVSGNMDGAWVDLITFPAFVDSPPSLAFDVSQIQLDLTYDQTTAELLQLENSGEGSVNYKVYVSSNNAEYTEQGRSVLGSYIYCPDRVVHAGETYTLQLTLYNTSPDNEWLKDAAIVFPQGVVLESATNFTGGTDALVFNGETGNGVTATWHGEDGNGYGVIKGGETATATLTISIEESFTGNFDLSCEVAGDVYGDEPHVSTNELSFRNLGAPVSWLSLEQNEGQVTGGGADELSLNFNSQGLEEGYYQTNLLFFDNFENEYIIPVQLHVEQYVDLTEYPGDVKEGITEVFPNPFSNYIDLKVTVQTAGEVEMEILDMSGKKINRLLHGELKSGNHVIRWNGNTDEGVRAKPGMYLCRFSKEGKVTYIRLIKQ